MENIKKLKLRVVQKFHDSKHDVLRNKGDVFQEDTQRALILCSYMYNGKRIVHSIVENTNEI